MKGPTDPHEFIVRNLNEHFERYSAFTRLVLTLATGSLSLLVALAGSAAGAAAASVPASIAFVLLCVSVLCGVLVQWQLVERPRRDIAQLEALSDQARENGAQGPVLLRKLPTLLEQRLFRLQTVSFVAAFIALTMHGVLMGGGQ